MACEQGHLNKGLADGDEAEPDNDGTGDFKRDEAENDGEQSRGAEYESDESVERGVAGACSVGLVGGVTDVECGGKWAAEGGGGKRANAVHEQRGRGAVVVAGDLDALKDLQGGEGIERGERKNDGEVTEPFAAIEEQEQVEGLR